MSDRLEIFEKLPDGVTLHDPADGAILQANEQFCNMLGYSEEELHELSFEDIHINEPPYTTEQAREYIRKAATEGPQTFEWRDETKDGEVLPVEVNLRVTTIDGEDRILAVVRDISERKERERELEQSHELTQALSTTFPDYTFVYNQEGEYLDVITGWGEGPDYYTPEELIGSNVEEIVDSETANRIKAAILEALDTGSLQQIEYPIETPGGTYWYEANLAPLSEGYEGHRAVVLSARDITERKRREQNLERYATLVELSGDPMYMLDDEGHFTYVNEALADMAGYDEESLLGEPVELVMEQEHVERGERLIQSLLASGDDRGTFEMDLITADGNRIPTENHITLMRVDGEFEGSVGVLRDISDRLEREERLQRERDRLDEFAGVVSHDLRNPLNVAEGHVELAKSEFDSEHLDAIDRALDRMNAIIDDVLTLARADSELGDVEIVELSQVAETCWRNVETDSARLVTAAEGSVEADESQLKQLLENLFRNAVEHGKGDVTITIGDLANGFYVEDDGPGIPEEKRDEVLKPGYSISEEGTGFGLSIVRNIAEAHGWSIDITTGSEGGARFEISGINRD